MHRSPTPLRWVLSRGAPAALNLSGIVTVLSLFGLVRPSAIAAQAIGTMQVTASVVRAEPAWAGLAAAQQVAGELAATPNFRGPRRVDLLLSSVELEFPAAGVPARPAISIQYLHN